MYVVTIRRGGYALFCMTPSERFAIGLTEDQQRVHVLERSGGDWTVCHDWPVEECSHTHVLTRLVDHDEPATLAALVHLARGPSGTRC